MWNHSDTVFPGSVRANPVAQFICANQTKCIQPYLQLKQTFNVYYCKHVGHGVRFYFLVKEGLLHHPQIRLVESPEAADVIVYLPVSADWPKTECKNPKYRNKTVVLDEGDYPQLFNPGDIPKVGNFLLYFKRSYVQRTNGKFKSYMNYARRIDVLPMTYTIADAYVRNMFNVLSKRDQELVCTLRGRYLPLSTITYSHLQSPIITIIYHPNTPYHHIHHNLCFLRFSRSPAIY